MVSVATLGLPSVAPPPGVPSVTTTVFTPSTAESSRIGICSDALGWFAPNWSCPFVGPPKSVPATAVPLMLHGTVTAEATPFERRTVRDAVELPSVVE